MKKEIKVYTSETCAYCKNVKELLNKKKVEFEEKPNKENREAWVQIQRLTGLAIFPTVVVGDNYYIPGRDFNNPEQLLTMLMADDNLDSFTPEVRSEQATKTLVYSINQGFARMIQELSRIKNEH